MVFGSEMAMISSVALLTVQDSGSPAQVRLLEVLVVAVVVLISLGTGLRGGSSILGALAPKVCKVGKPFGKSRPEDLEVLSLFGVAVFFSTPNLGFPFL